MKDQNCAYCMREEKPELYQGFGYYVQELKVSSLYVFREQSHLGRCIVAYKDHVSEIVDLTPEERALFLEDVANVAQAIHAAFSPDKVNYGFYGDTGKHLHCHLCPKYKDGFEWGGVFQMNPHIDDKDNATLMKIAEKIKAHLK
ncbi:MAG: HIT family protein [Bacilli bacterium]|nr:HIT family protein [Bacilli bacterium]